MRRLKLMYGITAFAVLFLLPSSPIFAQAAGMVCADRAKMVASLADKYGEQPVAAGVASNGWLIELLSAPDGLTWSIIITRPDRVACLMVSGDAWQDLPPAENIRGDPA